MAVFKTLHLALGRWYWFLLVTLTLITLHTFDHSAAALGFGSPFASTIISDENTEGFVLWHGGLTAADYTMTLVLLTLLYSRSMGAAAGGLQIRQVWRRPVHALRRLHIVMGRWYWYVFGGLIPITVHTADHLIFIALNSSPLSDTIVAKSFSVEGFLIWHSGLTILDYSITVLLLSLIYRQWTAAHTAPQASAAAGPVGA